ncbi:MULTISPECIES: hypothetical protein [unclassified Sphingomonas]|uniref:hypothetical protein n=1 Tax=unclassified Sphingomonas TaxID=196159 RepID=UPI0006F60948|nr:MULTISPECIES: hypothetical protein [unclassified Sphingomonas]KQX25925.1 hypothetical protein ASD17_00140 [Sphingomonas sp. Root1294]KQY68990.1 hypothetical protein ASD39_01335 [Sphingomonas sp. Root50]KRB89245.1 hypothetical protein ASE22_16250 [Sphingomonas sp. Root720]
MDRDTHRNRAGTSIAEPGRAEDVGLPSVRFDWLGQALPAGPWPSALRAALCDAMKAVGWRAVHAGEFAPLESLYRDFAGLFPRLLVDRDDIDRAADLYTLLHIMLWRRTQLLSELTTFNGDVVRPFAAFLARHVPQQPPRPAIRKIPRIAYLSETSDLFGSNAVARITVSLMLGQHDLREEADRPILYCINRPAPSLWQFAADVGLQLRDMARETPSRTVEAVIAQMAADEIDILIADSNCAVATMVMQRRPAAIQAFHENGFAAWAIPELDLAFLGITRPSPDLFDEGVTMVQTPRNTAFVFQRIERPEQSIAAVRAVLCTESGVAEPSVVYGVYGRMAKITADYMAQVETILLRDPNAIFFAGGTGRISPIMACKQASPAGDRMVIYNDFIDGHVISECIDVFLDSFPFPGGMSCIEVQARGVPVVWMAPPPGSEQLIIGDQRDPNLKARDGDHYVELARQVADPAAWGAFAETAIGIARRFGDMGEQAALVEGHLADAWARVRQDGRMAA